MPQRRPSWAQTMMNDISQKWQGLRAFVFGLNLMAYVLLGQGLAQGQSPQLVADINTVGYATPPESWPSFYTAVGSAMYFAASTRDAGRELWVNDAKGTRMVADIRPGPESSSPSNLKSFGGSLYFVADDGVHGVELWRSDGTRAGTSLVLDIYPGVTRSASREDEPLFTVLNNRLMFAADDGVHGLELWSSDGTSAGTKMLLDVYPGPGGSRPEQFTMMGGFLYFAAVGGLWKTDGTAAGTVQQPGQAKALRLLTQFGSHVYFAGHTTTTNHEVFRSDGTATGTQLFFEGKPGTGSGGPLAFAAGPSKLYFAIYTSAGQQLFSSDGTTAGTVAIAQIARNTPITYTYGITTIGDQLFFVNWTSNLGSELWTSDGTPAGTRLLKDLAPGSTSGNPPSLQAVGSTLYFYASSGGPSHVLWKSDGTTAGTTVVHPVASTGRIQYQRQYTEMRTWFVDDGKGGVVFSGTSNQTGEEMWRTDGTRAGTTLVADIDSAAAGDTQSAFSQISSAAGAVDLYGRTIFIADDGRTGMEPWVSDGTLNGTMQLADVNFGKYGSYCEDLTVVGSYVFFSATASGLGRELWVTDGTSAGTRLVKDIRAGSRSSYPSELCAYHDRVYFSASNGVTGAELWSSDGTLSGTAMVKEILPGSYGSEPQYLVVVNDRLLFRAQGTRFDPELWSSDGTAVGTVLLKDVRPGIYGSIPRDLISLGDRLIFAAKETSGTFSNPLGFQVWVSDGTTAGTTKVLDLLPTGDAQIGALTRVGNKVCFCATMPLTGRELWVTDGTTAGTQMVMDIRPGILPSEPTKLTSFGDSLLFRANDGVHGIEPWITDGSAAGTRMLGDLDAGPASSLPSDFFTAGQEHAWFSAYAAPHGVELWRTDGTAAGTTVAGDIKPGPGGSGPVPLAMANGQMLFSASDGVHGRELWSIDAGAVAYPFGVGCARQSTAPQLRSSRPRLGGLLQFIGSGGPQSAAAAILAISTPAPRPVVIGGSCSLFLSPAAIAVLPTVVVANSTWSLVFPLPPSNSLKGLNFAAQAAVGPTSSPLGVDLTQGLWLQLGL